MIIFPMGKNRFYNRKINLYLDAYIFGFTYDDIIEEAILDNFDDYLVREQKDKCISVFYDLYYWSNDKYEHKMDAFHELALYNFICGVEDIFNDDPEIKKIFDNDKECLNYLKEYWKSDKDYWINDKETFDDYVDYYNDTDAILSDCFIDHDFTFLDIITNNHNRNNTFLEERLGINLDYYKEIMPLDIQKIYENTKEKKYLYDDILKMLDFINSRIIYNKLYKSFWDNNEPKKETAIQILLDTLFNLYFEEKDFIDINREVDLSSGLIDFKFYKNNNEKVIIEVKKGENTNLIKNIDTQLKHYMDASKIYDAIYLIICYNEKELNRALKFKEKYQNNDLIYNINIVIFDVSPKMIATKKEKS